jgi:serine/threonine-protein kinase
MTEQAAVRHESARVVSQPAAPGSAPPPSTATLQLPLPLVGRDDDLAWLEDRRNEAKNALVPARIIGDAGMGKTRLLREFLAVSAAAGDVVVATGPDPSWAEVGYHTLRSAIVSLAALPENGGQMSDWPAASAEARSGLVEIFGSSSGKSGKLTPTERRFAAAEALRWALVRANARSRGHRVVLAVDDVQNVDGASRNAFVDAVAEPPLVPVLLVAAHTPGFDPGFLEGVMQPRVLQGLPGDVVLKVLTAAGVKASIPAPTGKGVPPLYVDQLVRYMREQGAQPPSRLADLIAQRVERLPAGARRALQAFSILGDSSTMTDIREMVPDETDVEASVFALLQSGMVEQDEGLVRTAHPLLREIVLAMIPATARRELHTKAAQIAEDRDAALEVRALHQFHAQNAFEALVLLEQVANQAAARADAAGNVMALRRGLELARRELFRGELDDPMHAVAIFSRKLGEALATTGALTDAEGVLREALDMTDRGQDRARVLGALATVAHGRQRDQEAQGYLKEALDLAKKSGAQDLVSSLEDLKRAIAV